LELTSDRVIEGNAGCLSHMH